MASPFANVISGASTTEGPELYALMLEQAERARRVRAQPYEGHGEYGDTPTGRAHKKLDRMTDRTLRTAADWVIKLGEGASAQSGFPSAAERDEAKGARAREANRVLEMLSPEQKPAQAALSGPLRGTEPEVLKASPYALQHEDAASQILAMPLDPLGPLTSAGKGVTMAAAPLARKLGARFTAKQTAEAAAEAAAKRTAEGAFATPRAAAIEVPGVNTLNIGAKPQALTEMLGVTRESPAVPASLSAVEEVSQPATSAALKKGKPKTPRGLVNLGLREMSVEDAFKTALENKHLFPIKDEAGATIGYTSAPRNIRSEADLEANRQRMFTTVSDRIAELEAAGIEPGSWYESQRRGIGSVIDDPQSQHRVAQAHGNFSAQTDPYGETGLVNTAWNRFWRGDPIGMVKTKPQTRKFEHGMTDPSGQMAKGPKVEPYAVSGDPTIPPKVFGSGANDFRHAQFLGYTDLEGKPWEAGLSKAQHNFIDAENLRLVHRMNQEKVGGRSDWTVGKMQEAAWIGEKANSLQRRFPNRYPNTPEGRLAAINEGAKTGEDALKYYAVSPTYENIPGKGLGHDERIIDAPFKERQRYGIDWTGEGKRDLLYPGALQTPTKRAVGSYEGEMNPVNVAAIQGDFLTNPSAAARRKNPSLQPIPEGQVLDPGFIQSMTFAEKLRGGIDVQRHVAANKPMAGSARKPGAQTNAVIEHDTPLTLAETQRLVKALPKGWSHTPTEMGTMIIAPDGTSARQASAFVKEQQKAISKALKGRDVQLKRAGMEGVYEPVYVTGAGVPEEHGKGIVTSKVLEEGARTPEKVVQRMADSPELRQRILEKMDHDAQLASEGRQIRPDVQKLRDFFGKEAWDKVIDYMRKHKVTAAVAMPALGFSLEGMAAEPAPEGQR